LIRHPEALEWTGFRLEFTPYLIRGRNDDFFMETVVYGETLISGLGGK
jgi:hypothetical protein